MPRGHEDWGIRVDSFGGTSVDLAELGARLGSPYVWSRTGNVIIVDNFNISLGQWSNYGATLDDSPAIYHKNVVSGSGCCRLLTPSTNTTLSGIKRQIPLIGRTKNGIELVFTPGAGNYKLRFATILVIESAAKKFELVFNFNDTILYYLDSGSNEVAIQSFLDIASTYTTPVILKIVIDTNNQLWSYIQINDVNIDMSGITSIPVLFGETGTHIEFRVQVDDENVNSHVSYIDSFVYTIDEP